MLTTAQAATVKAYVENDPVLSLLPHTPDGAFAIADALRAVDPNFIVWRTSVSQDEIMMNGFDWVQVDNLTIGKARIWEWLFNNQQRVMNPSKANVRAGIDEAWKGTTAMVAVRTAVYTHCKRPANILERLLATGTGTAALPATMGYEGTVSYYEVLQVMGW